MDKRKWIFFVLSFFGLLACQTQVDEGKNATVNEKKNAIGKEQDIEKIENTEKNKTMNDYQNELANETSPYLLQHKNNPVHWLPWGEKAFKIAKERNVPIIVSIGYSTCHWCHVMEHEVFEDAEAAKMMNQWFVAIKVDREERPEVDEIYMHALQAMQEGGGWPLNMFITPEGKPFYGGTYFPKENWLQILTAIHNSWENEKAKIDKVSEELTKFLQQSNNYTSAEMPKDVWPALEQNLNSYYDKSDPAWGNAPKFPSSQMLRLVLLLKDSTNKSQAVNILTTMQDSGLHDIVGGGFHRYSTDSKWRVPHFEKMLYDNALLAMCYFIAGYEYDRKDLTHTAMRTLDYLLRDMRVLNKDGSFLGYACAENADDPGGEGSFYAWNTELLAEVIEEKEAEILAREWNIKKGIPHKNHLGHQEPIDSHIPFPRGGEMKGNQQTNESIEKRLSWEKYYPALVEHRAKRPRPGLDYKVLSSWNGLALSAFAHGARFTEQEKYKVATRELADALLKRHTSVGFMRLADIPAIINDYAFVLCGLMDAYDALGDADLIEGAIKIADEAIEKFSHDEGGFFTTTSERKDLIVRSRVLYDNAYPSGNSAMALGLTRLWNITSNSKYLDEAKKAIETVSTIVNRINISLGTLLTAYLALERGHMTIVVTGNGKEKQELLSACRKNNFLATIVDVEKVKNQNWPVLEGRKEIKDCMALLCIDKTCLEPVRSVEDLRLLFIQYKKMFSF